MPTDFFGRVMVVFNRYGMSMLQGAGVSLKIALVGTLVGCLIGFAVGIVQTIDRKSTASLPLGRHRLPR